MKKYLLLGIPLGLVAVLYLPFLGNAFVSDDIAGIVDGVSRWTWLESIGWPRVIHLGVLLQYWTYQLFGPVPWPYRLTNILFHMGNVVMVWLLIEKMFKKRSLALFVSVLFAIHPLAIESITWISGGVYAEYSFFFLLSFLLFIEKKILVSVLCFLLSILISEKAAPLVFVFLVYEWIYGNIKRNWRRMISYGIVSMSFILFYVSRLSLRVSDLEQANYQTISGLYNPFFQLPSAVSSYIALFVWPHALTLYHSWFRYTVWELGVRMLVTLVFFATALYGLIKKRSVGFWLWWVVCSLGITLLPLKIGWIVAERYAYLALVGFCGIAGLGLDALLSAKKWHVVRIVCMTAVVLMLCTRTIIRNNDWRDAEHLWIATAAISPNDPHSWNNMGDVYGRRGEYEKSIEAFTRATQINPNYADAYHNLANSYVRMKKYDEAIPFFEKALSINPNLWQSYQDLAFIAAARKEYEKAIQLLEQALHIEPNNAVLQENREVLRRTLSY